MAHKYDVAVSGSMTIWADDENEAFDKAHQICAFLKDHCNTEVQTSILPDEEGVEDVTLEIEQDGVVDTGEDDD